MLKNFLLPSFYHQYIFSRLYAKYLNKLDIIARKADRKILRLPHDLPKAAFHAKEADGGLGLPSLRLLIPIIANKRLVYNKPNLHLLQIENRTLKNSDQISRFFKKRLYDSVDGKDLTECSKCPSAHRWVDDGTSFLSGKDYLKCIHGRYGVLFSRSRCSRGRERKNKLCRRGCGQIESLNHIIQGCYATRFVRIKRHDAIVNYVQKVAQNRGVTVHKKPNFKIDDQTLKPDLVCYTTDRV